MDSLALEQVSPSEIKTEALPLKEAAGANGSSGRAGLRDSISRPLFFPEVFPDVVIVCPHYAHDDACFSIRHRHQPFLPLVFP